MIRVGIKPDPSLDNPDDLWGIGVDPTRCPLRGHRVGSNPRLRSPLVKALGFDLSENSKTVLCLSQWFDSCRPSAWCYIHCYGNGTRFQCGDAPAFLKRNYELLEAIGAGELPDRVVLNLAEEILGTCRSNGLDNLRVPGVGDLTDGLRMLVTAIAELDPRFTVWGFTRKPEQLLEMPVRRNLVFWLSLDYTMRARLDDAIEAAERHGTGISYCTEVGEAYAAAEGRRVVPTSPTLQTLRRDAAFQALLQEAPVPWRVAHGFHGGTTVSATGLRTGQQIQTHLGIEQECPATDPLARGNVTCQLCRWCMTKPKKRDGTLRAHRRRAGWY